MPVAAYSFCSVFPIDRLSGEAGAARAGAGADAAAESADCRSRSRNRVARGARSLKNTAAMTPRLAVLPSACPYDASSVVNSKRRASLRLVCQPRMVTVS